MKKFNEKTLKIAEVPAKKIFSGCKVPGFDFCVNPYGGCPYGCNYCYVSTRLKNLAGHSHDEWGAYLDLKNYKSLDVSKLHGKRVLLGSATDPYNHCEATCRKTREILRILPEDIHLEIQTKSNLILEDIELLKRFLDLQVGISVCSLDSSFNADMEPNVPSVEQRLSTLKKLHDAGIRTYLAVTVFPRITNIERLFDLSKGIVDRMRFNSLGLGDSTLKRQVLSYIESKYPQYHAEYELIYRRNDVSFWENLEDKITKLGVKYGVPVDIYFNRPAQRKRREEPVAEVENNPCDPEEGRLTREEWLAEEKLAWEMDRFDPYDL